MYMRWALVGLMITLAVTSASDLEHDTAIADTENAINTEPTLIAPAFDSASVVSLVPRREGGGGGKSGGGGGAGGKAKAAGGSRGGGGGGGGGEGHHKNSGGSSGGQNKIEVGSNAGIKKLNKQNGNKAATSAFPSGRWKATRTCIHKTGSAGNVYATLCANPGQSPTNIHPAKQTAKPSKQPGGSAPKPKYTGCSTKTLANGIVTVKTGCTKIS